jgi:hypothetical protein
MAVNQQFQPSTLSAPDYLLQFLKCKCHLVCLINLLQLKIAFAFVEFFAEYSFAGYVCDGNIEIGIF